MRCRYAIGGCRYYAITPLLMPATDYISRHMAAFAAIFIASH